MQMASSYSRLNTFQESKENIIKIFSELFNYINDCNVFLRSIHKSGAQFQALINAGEVKSLSSLVEKVKRIQSVISRDNMKCVFFGRTSNGKSTVINAMLGDSILPASMGQTTSCFVEIRGTTESQRTVSIISSQRSRSIPVGDDLTDLVLELAQDVSTNKLPTDSLIRIDWPNQRNTLLSKDVVLLDSPGFNNYPDIDQCIDKYCLDADVFVLVVNSESTLDHTEKAFFHKVCDKLSKPNVFILNNRWDASDKDTKYVNKIRNQHLEKCVNFLTKELQVCSKMEAEKRVFFVSAKEVLIERSKNNEAGSGRQSSGSNHHSEGWQSRQDEFTAFEEILEKTLSESATRTKFATHSSQGQDIVEKVSRIMEELKEKAKEEKDAAVSRKTKIHACCDDISTKQNKAHDKSISEISILLIRISEKVSHELRRELRNLDDVITKFNQKKQSDYKIALSQHVAHHFRNKMKSLCRDDFSKLTQAVITTILKMYQALVQDEDVIKAMRQSVNTKFVVQFDIDSNDVVSNFDENQCSGFSTDVAKFESSMPDMNRGMMTLSTLLSELPSGKIMLGAAFTAMLVTAGILIYEAITGQQDEKEKFKADYRSYVANNIEPLIAEISMHIAEQIRSAIEETLKELDNVVDGYIHKMRVGIGELEDDIQRYQEIVAKSRNLKKTAQDLEKILKDFHKRYILV